MHQLCLRLVQTLVSYGHDLMENVTNVLLPVVHVRPIVSMGRWNRHAPLCRVASQSNTAESVHNSGLLVHQFAATQSMDFWEGNELCKKSDLTTASAAFCGVISSKMCRPKTKYAGDKRHVLPSATQQNCQIQVFSQKEKKSPFTIPY